MHSSRLGKDRAQTTGTFGHAVFIHLRHLHSHSAQMKRCWVMCGSIKRRENYTTHTQSMTAVLYCTEVEHNIPHVMAMHYAFIPKAYSKELLNHIENHCNIISFALER